MDDKVLETISDFQQRKRDHIQLALDDTNQTTGQSDLDRIELIHEALPEIDFAQVDISTHILDLKLPTPFYINSMTAGHPDGININERLAIAAEKQGWLMGVGSQRRQLFDKAAGDEWLHIRQVAPKIKLIANIGITQAIATESTRIQALIDSIQAVALFIHLNPLQEVLQPEGTPYFSGGLKTIERLCRDLTIPIIIKETGCGFSKQTLKRLLNVNIAAVDISGFGGTHWGRIEGKRAQSDKDFQIAYTFKDWGISTIKSLLNAREIEPDYALFASGGIRSGLDAAKCLALGAHMVGFAKPMLESALRSVDCVTQLMKCFEEELKIALFCTGSANLSELRERETWLIKT